MVVVSSSRCTGSVQHKTLQLPDLRGEVSQVRVRLSNEIAIAVVDDARCR